MQNKSLELNCSSVTFVNGLSIHYTEDLDGGGSKQYDDFLQVLSKIDKTYHSCLEWCAGHGVIGFSILDSKYCKFLHLMEKYEPAYYVNKLNVSFNKLINVSVQCASKINQIPADKKFELVISNPPHNPLIPETFKIDDKDNDRHLRICVDLDWKIHEEFFKNIKQYLVPGADILLSEMDKYPELITYAENNGLKFIDAYPAPELAKNGCERACIMHYKYI